MSSLWEPATPAERAAAAEHQRISRAVTIPPTPGAPVRQFATDAEYYAALDAADANQAARVAAVRAATCAAAAPATPAPAMTRPTTTQPEVPHFVNNLPTIGQPNGPPEPVDGNIRYMPAAGRGAVVNTAEDTITVHSADPRSELAQATSHIDAPTMELHAEAANLAASVKAAEDRVAAAKTPDAKTQALQQLERANQRAAYGMARLESIAKARAGT